jgi:hypothetical protein
MPTTGSPIAARTATDEPRHRPCSDAPTSRAPSRAIVSSSTPDGEREAVHPAVLPVDVVEQPLHRPGLGRTSSTVASAAPRRTSVRPSAAPAPPRPARRCARSRDDRLAGDADQRQASATTTPVRSLPAAQCTSVVPLVGSASSRSACRPCRRRPRGSRRSSRSCRCGWPRRARAVDLARHGPADLVAVAVGLELGDERQVVVRDGRRRSGPGPVRCSSPVLRRSTTVRTPSSSTSRRRRPSLRSWRLSARSSTPGRVVRPSTVGSPPMSRALTAPSSSTHVTGSMLARPAGRLSG